MSSAISSFAASRETHLQNQATRNLDNHQQFTKDDFMKIFVKQLTTQNPTKPYDSSSMLQQMSQLASMSATEALEKTISGLNASLNKSRALEASQLIGRNVQVISNQSTLFEGQGLNGTALLPEATNKLSVSILDEQYRVLKKIPLGNYQSSGAVNFSWDGKTEDGKLAPAGVYHVIAEGSIAGQQTQIKTAGMFKVHSVGFAEGGKAQVYLDKVGSFDLSSIISIA